MNPLTLSYCEFWIYLVGVNTKIYKLSYRKFCIYTNLVNSKFTIWQHNTLVDCLCQGHHQIDRYLPMKMHLVRSIITSLLSNIPIHLSYSSYFNLRCGIVSVLFKVAVSSFNAVFLYIQNFLIITNLTDNFSTDKERKLHYL